MLDDIFQPKIKWKPTYLHGTAWRAALAISSMNSKGVLLVPYRAWLQSR